LKDHLVKLNFLNFINRYRITHNNTDTINLGILYSCGVDSSVLLDIANRFKDKLNLNITILYVCFNDFQNSKDADNLAIKMAELYHNKIITDVCDLSSAKHLGLSIKEMARKAMKSIAFRNEFDLVLTAHHADDQIETVLFRLFRGAGIEGLTGMEHLSEFKHDGQTRTFGKPFLDIKKSDINEYARTNVIHFIEDDTNYNIDTSDRNYIRNNIIPLVEHRFNINSILLTIKNLKEYNEEKFERNINVDINSGKWHINDIINLSPGNRLFVIREYFRKIHGFNLSKKSLDDIKKRLDDDFKEMYINLPNNWVIAREGDYLVCSNVNKISAKV